MATAADAAAQLESFNKTRVNPEAALSTAENKYGVTALQDQLSSLRSLSSNLKKGIDNVDPSVTGRTQGSLVTEAQRNAIVNNEQQPLVKNFNEVGGQLSDTNGEYQNATGLASNYANSLMDSDKQRYNELFGQYTTLAEQERLAADAAESKRRFDIQQQTAARAAASSGAGVSLGSLGAATGANPATASKSGASVGNVSDVINALIKPIIQGGMLDGYSERTALPKLYATFPNIPPATLAAQFYAARKPYEAAPAPSGNSGSTYLNLLGGKTGAKA